MQSSVRRNLHFDHAALEPEKWPAVLLQLAETTGSDFAQIIGFGADLNIDFNWLAGERDGSDMSREIIALAPALNYRVVAKLAFPDEAILDERHYAKVTPGLPSHDYLEICQRHGIEHGCQTDLYDGPEGFVGMALLRSASRGRTTRAQRLEFDRQRRDAANAIALQIALEREGYRIIAGTLEAMNVAAFVFDSAMKVNCVTPRADDFLVEGAMHLGDGILHCPQPGDDAVMQRLFSAFARGTGTAGRFLVRDAGGRSLVAQLNRLPVREYGLGFAPFAVMVVKLANAASPQAVALLRANLGLTEAEAQVALMLGTGEDRSSIQAARGIGRETLRSHIRSIFGKLGVRREADAVRLLSQFID